MASFAVVMLTIILIINFSNFNGMRLQLNAILDYLVSHDGIMPAGINPGELEDAGAIFNEEFRYTTRYFTVILNEEKRPLILLISRRSTKRRRFPTPNRFWNTEAISGLLRSAIITRESTGTTAAGSSFSWTPRPSCAR